MNLFADMYKERHFLHNRDLKAYARRQAGSCLFLVDQLTDWVVGMHDAPLRLVLMYLMGVHGRQYGDLGGEPHAEPPKSSFYYCSLLGRTASLGLPRIALHAVMYERGRLRYEELTKWPQTYKFWERFLWDAQSNRDLCLHYMMMHSTSQARTFVQKAVKLEAELMAHIDERNGEK